MSTASMVGRIALLAAVRSPTPAPWSPDDAVAQAVRSRQSGAMPPVPPGTDPPSFADAATSLMPQGVTLPGVGDSLAHGAERLADTAPGRPPVISTAVVCVAWWGLFAVQVLRVALM